MTWLERLGPLIEAAIGFAQALHPLPGSGAVKLATATALVQTGLSMAIAAGVIPPTAASTGTAIVTAINNAVKQMKTDGRLVPVAAPAAAPAKK